jgi:hypothetical protein
MKIREIKEADLPAVTALFIEAFPRRRHTYWQRGFKNMRELPATSDHARYGYLFEDDETVQGALLTLSTQVGEVCPRINLSAWCARPAYRMMAALLHAKVMRQEAGSYLNLSPAEHIKLEVLGFKPYTRGVCLLDVRAALRPGRGHYLTQYKPLKNNRIPTALKLVAARHYRYGCSVLMCNRGSAPAELFIYRVKWIKGVLPCAQMIYGAPERILAAAGPIMRHLLKKGIPLLLFDTIERHDMIGVRTYAGCGLRYCNGTAPAVGDMLDSEFALFGP